MNIVKTHFIEQPKSDITTFVISCNRINLLEITLESFIKTRDITTKVVICDDSGDPNVFDILKHKFGHYADIICYPENRGLWWVIDFMTTHCNTDYIFILEDDWKFIKPGYLTKSKEILSKYRDIGTIDLSWRTIEEEGIETYHKELIEGFYYKKPFKITQNHYYWCSWVGSPNLKRRDDLLLLGRVEKWHTEWNIDRRFHALGFKGCFINDRYVRHIGDNNSIMVSKRNDELKSPEEYYPIELKKNRTYPEFNYWLADIELIKDYPFVRNTNPMCLVTCLVDLNRRDRDFNHYVSSLLKICDTDLPLVVFVPPDLEDLVYYHRGSKPTIVKVFDVSYFKHEYVYKRICEIMSIDTWLDQSDWIRDSVISNPDYIMLTFYKLQLLKYCKENGWFNADSYYWIDAGIFNSYMLPKNINDYNLLNLPRSGFCLSTYPFFDMNEIHGFSISGFKEMVGKLPDRICRASLFGGGRDDLESAHNEFFRIVFAGLNLGCVGSEEAIFTIMLAIGFPFKTFDMSSGDVNSFLDSL